MTTVTCGACGTTSPVGQKFCAECGSELPRVCATCGAPVTASQKFCPECGAGLGGATVGVAPSSAPSLFPTAAAPTATASGAVGPPGAVPAAPSVPSPSLDEPSDERRLVTALFCDLVGFTPLAASLDPEEVREIQSAYFSAMAEQAARYGGTVEKYAGDAVLVLFGAPIAHEDDAERALERQVAALEAKRNEQHRTITWSFTAYDARTKLRRLYPNPQN